MRRASVVEADVDIMRPEPGIEHDRPRRTVAGDSLPEFDFDAVEVTHVVEFVAAVVVRAGAFDLRPHVGPPFPPVALPC